MTYRFILGLLVAVSLSGCGSGVSATKTAGDGSAGPAGTGSASTSIVLQGVPPGSVTVGGKYSFRPSVSSGNNVLTFAIEGQPSWATFDTTTGTLSGTPGRRDLGLSGLITILASDGVNAGKLGPFTIRVDTPTAAAASLTISGTPIASVLYGNAYSFTPAATDPSAAALTFSVKNTPSWANFNST